MVQADYRYMSHYFFTGSHACCRAWCDEGKLFVGDWVDPLSRGDAKNCRTVGMDTSTKANLMSTIYAAQAAMSITRTIAGVVK